VANGLALTCKFHVWHSWEGPETATGAYGTCCKPAHTVHVVNNFNFNFNYIKHHYIQKLIDGMTFAFVSMGTADMLANGLTKALPEPKHTMIFKRCMRAAPSGDYFACIIVNDLIEGLSYYISVNTCTFTVVNGISEYVQLT
jgi:hypothetical protein